MDIENPGDKSMEIRSSRRYSEYLNETRLTLVSHRSRLTQSNKFRPSFLFYNLEEYNELSHETHDLHRSLKVVDYSSDKKSFLKYCCNNCSTGYPIIRWILASIGLAAGFSMLFIPIDIEQTREINQTLGITIWIATLWLTEVIPLVVTAFIPLWAFPLFGILSSSVVAAQYMNNIIWLMISGFLMSLTAERWGLMERISLKILSKAGKRLAIILLAMMLTTFFFSMFMSNTATSVMMTPNALFVASSLEITYLEKLDALKSYFDDEEKMEEHKKGTENIKKSFCKYNIACLLGIAYSASVGGMSSLVGTPPNLALEKFLSLTFPDAPPLTFAQFLAFALPIGLIMLGITYCYLCMVYLRGLSNDLRLPKPSDVDEDSTQVPSSRNLFSDHYDALGPWFTEQVIVGVAFIVLILLWFFRADFGNIPGWSEAFPEPSYISDGTTGMFICFILFVVPARTSKLPLSRETENDNDESYKDAIKVSAHNKWTTLLDWETANKMPYHIVFLLGGGFALATAFIESGLSTFIGDQLARMNVSLPALLFIMIFTVVWLTELTSNTSTSNVMIPIAFALAVATQSSPYIWGISAAMACSMAFCLPVATPPNMIVFSTGRLPMIEMNHTGAVLNFIGITILFGACFTIIPAVTGVAPFEFPTWAATTSLNN